MSLDDRLTNLMFLLSLTPLATACPAGDDTSSDGPTTSQPTTNGPPTGGETTEQPQTTTGMDATGTGTTAEPGTTAVDPDTTAGETTAGLMCDERPPPVGEIDPACIAYEEQLNECYYDGMLPQECIDLYTAYCQENLDAEIMEYGEMCGMAFVDYYTCLTQLTCEELRMTDDPCPAELTALDMACGGA